MIALLQRSKLLSNAIPKSAAATSACPFPSDPRIAGLLAAHLAQDHRLGFARSFTLAVVSACRRARGLSEARPDGLQLGSLSTEAAAAAESLGGEAAEMPPSYAAYFIGTIYAAALPDPYRAAHGVFY